MNKKLIVSLAIMAIAGAAAIGGTMAYFSDTETSKGNTFTAGSLDLTVDSQCTYNGVTSTQCGNWVLKIWTRPPTSFLTLPMSNPATRVRIPSACMSITTTPTAVSTSARWPTTIIPATSPECIAENPVGTDCSNPAGKCGTDPGAAS